MKIISIFLLTAMLSMAPTLIIAGQNVHASNSLEQQISQSQLAGQLGICVSGENTLVSCNNLSFQDQRNFGSNAAAQTSEGGDGNEAEQQISQSQESRQGALCVSGSGTFFSCNNVSEQNQENEGNNAAAQTSSGDSGETYKTWKNSYPWSGSNSDGNELSQKISQSQQSDQRSLCVSGSDTKASCNNFSSQSQVNYGSNAAAQNR